MTEGIEIHFDAEEGHLRLDCGEEEFLRIRDLIISGAATGDRFDAFADGIRCIVVRRTPAVRDTTPRRFRRGIRIVLVWLAVGVSVAVWVVGLVTVIWWLLAGRR
jgi:hypothetical protein